MSDRLADELRGLAPSPRRAAAAAAEMQERAARSGAADLAHASMDSPVGPLLLVRSERGLVRLAYAAGDDAERELDRIARRISPRVVRSATALDHARRELDEYFAGSRTAFETPVDLALVSSFARDVLSAATEIPYGQVTTYGELADDIGRPRAGRAVGNALGSNPVPVIVPCHRVLRAGGGLGGYTGGTAIKEALLGIEGY